MYLALLQLGQASAQDIADKANINRTTSYPVIESLRERGLINSVTQEKKVQYIPESPERLIFLMDRDVTAARERLARVQENIPRMLALFRGADEKPAVRYFEGAKALIQLRREMLEEQQTIDQIDEMFCVDEVLQELVKIQPEQRFAVTRQVTRVRVLMAIKPGFLPPFFDRRKIEAREMDYAQAPFSGEVALLRDRVYVFAGQAKGLGIVIESTQISTLIRAIFEAAWHHAKIWEPPEEWGTILPT